MTKPALIISLTAALLCQGCVAATVGTVAGTAVGVTGAVIGGTAKVAGAGVRAAIPGDSRDERDR